MHRKTDPAIEWLSQLVAPLSPEEFLSKQAASLLAKSGQAEPPFNPQKALPPTVKRVELARLSRDGMLIPVQGGFIIKINSLKPLVRQNFTCAHEIGHTFFYDLAYLLVPGFGVVRNQERIIFLFSFAASVLAGYGALALVRPLPRPARQRFEGLCSLGD